MSIENEAAESITLQKPQVYLNNILFNDGTKLSLTHNNIVVFTGANNSGKSQVLKDIENSLNYSNKALRVVITKAEYDYCGTIEETLFLNSRFLINQQGYFQPLEGDGVFEKNSLINFWNNHTLYNGLHNLFVKRLDTELRITSSNDLVRNNKPEKHPIYKLYNSETLATTLSPRTFIIFTP